jgi:hypothetical protein
MGRLGARSGRPWAVLLLLLVVGGLGALLQSAWMEMEIYSLLRPQMAVRWLGLALLAETAVALPWAAVRGTLLWRQLVRDGHLEEYRRSRLSASSIALGAGMAALSPVVLLLALSLGVGLIGGVLTRDLPLRAVVTAHLLLGAQCLAFGALGMWLSGKLRYPAAAIPVALAVLAAFVGAVWTLNPFLRSMTDPSPWIYAALLPNPVTAVGNALDTDVLRFSWIYERVRAHEYFFVYPPAWQTGGFYLGLAALLTGLVARGILQSE